MQKEVNTPQDFIFLLLAASPDFTMSASNDKDSLHESAAIDTIDGFPFPS